jgi:thiol-disulfide isomerase/thioredoxin
MVMTPSTMRPLGTTAPDFELPDPRTGETVSLDDIDRGSGVLLMFICNHCPFVRHIREELSRFAQHYRGQGLGMAAISANDAENYPADAPEEMAKEAESMGYVFPYLYDESQEVAKAYGAACTPDFFLFDRDRKLVYRGQFDASRPGNDVPITGEDLRAAADAVLDGRAVPRHQTPSMGCNIKWKAGNAPEYASG